MNNTIGFSNFRRFIKFPEIDLGDITILVGGNNAGKSTLVKAMLLMRDFLLSRIESVNNSRNIFKSFNPHFSFDTEHVNVGEFYRAFCRQSPRKEDTISFTMGIDKFRFLVNIRGERKPGIIPEVSLIAVSDDDRKASFTFDFTKNQMTARFGYEETALVDDNQISYDESGQGMTLDQRLNLLQEKLSLSTDLDEISKIKLEIEKVKKELNLHSIRNAFAESIEQAVTVDMSFFMGDNVGKLLIPELVRGFANYSEVGTLGDKRSIVYKEREGKKNFLRGKSAVIKTISDELEIVLNMQFIEYIYAHSVNHSSLYAECANSSDYTKRTIHEFYTSRISSGDDEFSLIEDWLDEFGIGKSLKVIPYNGDNYRVVIFDDDNPEITSDKRKGYPGGIDLADKGMGSIQLVVLLLRLSTLIRRYKGKHLTILLEEPEQNLHPAIQSQLADLLNTISLDYGVRFIVETHSEYLVRHIQVLAAKYFKKGVQNIPFKVFYITGKNSHPYDDMGFQRNGKFVNSFGPGFFNVADDAAMELFDLDDDNL